MMRRAVFGVVSTVLAASAGRVSADDFAVAQIPALFVVSVTAGGAEPEGGLVDAVEEGTASRAADGDRLLRSLDIVSAPADLSPDLQRSRFKSGETAFFAGQLEAAALHFSKIAADFEAHPEAVAFYPELRPLLFRSLLHLAAVAYGRGDRLLVDKYLERAVRMNEPVPSASEFPPWLCQSFEEIRNRIARGPSGGLSLSAAEGCALFLNGGALGPGPLFSTLPAGEAFVRVKCGDSVSPVQRVTIAASAAVTFRPAMLSASTVIATRSGARLDASPETPDAALIDDLVAVGRAAGVERLIAVISRKDAASLVLVDVRAARGIRTAPISVPVNAKAAVEASRLLAARPPSGEPEPPVAMGYDGAPRPWYKDSAAWSAALCGAAALGAGIGLAAARGTASRTAPWAVGLMAAGGAAVVAGTVLFFIQPTVTGTGDASASLGVTVRGDF